MSYQHLQFNTSCIWLPLSLYTGSLRLCFWQWNHHFPGTRHNILVTPLLLLYLSSNTLPSSMYSRYWIITSHIGHFLLLLITMCWVQILFCSLGHFTAHRCILSMDVILCSLLTTAAWLTSRSQQRTVDATQTNFSPSKALHSKPVSGLISKPHIIWPPLKTKPWCQNLGVFFFFSIF